MHKDTIIDKIEVLERGHLQVRRATYLVDDDGTRTLLGYHRVAYVPGADLTQEDPEVKMHAALAWTPERLEAFRQHMAAKEAKRG